MGDSMKELPLDDLPRPPLYRLVDEEGRDVFAEAEVGGEAATVGVLFGDAELAREFSAGAAGHGMEALSGLEPRALRDWGAVEVFAVAGEDYVLVVAGEGAGLFYAGDVARKAAERDGEIPFPLYLFSDEKGEAPLITVETDGGQVLVVALFGSAEGASAFREHASHLGLPGGLGRIDDAEGLGRHARVAKAAGAEYAVVDPESGLAEAIPLEELMR